MQLPPEIQTKLVYPPRPEASDLVCTAEPLVPDMIATDTAGAEWAEAVRQAGADCRSKLDSIRVYVGKWPK